MLSLLRSFTQLSAVWPDIALLLLVIKANSTLWFLLHLTAG
jgi:hypothetical protein